MPTSHRRITREDTARAMRKALEREGARFRLTPGQARAIDDRMIRPVGSDAFPLHRGDWLRLTLADWILGKRLVRQLADYLYDQGAASGPRHLTVRPRKDQRRDQC